MTLEQLNEKLEELIALPHETEWAEFKHNNSDPQMIGEYLSAISNSAALEINPSATSSGASKTARIKLLALRSNHGNRRGKATKTRNHG